MLVSPTSGTWVDTEFAHVSLGVIDCETADVYDATATGRLLGANLLGVPLDAVAELASVAVAASHGEPDVVTPATAISLGDHAYANPLTVSALNDALTIDLTGLLALPLDVGTGVLNQYAQALPSGVSVGAAGAVLDSGAIDLNPATTGPSAPTTATLSLDPIVAVALGDEGAELVADVAALDLSWGAVAGIASLDQCIADYTGSLLTALAREYLIASFALHLESPLVADVVSAVDQAVTDLTGELNTLTSANGALVAGVTSGLTALLGSLLDTLSIGGISIALTADFDASAVTDLLDDTISDSEGIVEIDLSTGSITIDIAALVDPVNGLNAREPNSEILIDAAMILNLQNAVTEALGEWIAQVSATLQSALDAVTLSGSLSITFTALGLDVIEAGLALNGASLTSLVTNSAVAPQAVVTVEALSLVQCPANIITNPLGYAVSVLVCPLLAGVTALLTGGLQGVLGVAITDLLTPITAGLGSTLQQLSAVTTSPLVELIATLTAGLLGVDGVVSVLVNVQNQPHSGGPAPGDWLGIPAGRFDVAALRVAVLGLLGAGNDVDIVLARGSVGPNTR